MTVLDDLEKYYPFIVALTFGFVVQCQVMKNNVENTIDALLTDLQNNNWSKTKFKENFSNFVKAISSREKSKVLRNFMFFSFLFELLILILAKINEHTTIFKENKFYLQFAFLTNILVFFTFALFGLVMAFINPYSNLYSSNWERKT